jgi:hypothetical protein
MAGSAVLIVGLLATSTSSTSTRLITSTDEPSPTTIAPSPTTTEAPHHHDEPATTTTTTAAPHHERPQADRMTISCGSGNGSAAVTCEWSGVLEEANHLVLMREKPGTPSQAIWSTDDADTTRHVDDTAQQGVTYVYRISSYHDDRFLETSNPVRVKAGGGETPSPTTTAPPASSPSQQWYIKMTCQPDPEHVVVCTWAEPPVAVADWRVVRRHEHDNEIPIPTTHDRRIIDPTAEPSTTYTYVLNGYDANGHSVVLASATVTTGAGSSSVACCTSGADHR